MKILCVCLSSTLQRAINFEDVKLAEVNRSKNYIQDASGKAVNSARVLNQLEKGCVKFLCPAGRDNSKEFEALAKNDGLDYELVKIPGKIRECWTLIDQKNGTTTEIVVGEPSVNGYDYSRAEKKLLARVKSLSKKVDGVLLAGSRPSFFNEELCAQIARLVALEGKLFMADYFGRDLQKTLDVCTPEIIKINSEEFVKTFVNESFVPDGSCLEEWKALDLQKQISIVSERLGNTVVVTRGKDSTYAAKCGFFYECPVENITPVNTTACGDSFSAGFLYEFLTSGSVKESLQKGTWCAARNAERVRTGDVE